MKKRLKEVIYRSVWNEGAVDTNAKLDLQTGEIVDIESTDEGANFEEHFHDVIISLNGDVEALVEDINGFDYAIDMHDVFLFA